jgi:CRP-like cAMP-binding protein
VTIWKKRMFDTFRKYLENKITLTDTDYKLIQSVSVIKKLRKRQYLLQEGDVWRLNAFICSGLVRSYIVDSNGHEHIMNFSPENYWTGDRESLASELPSKYNIDAIEESEILLIKKNDFEMLCKTIPVFNDLINSILQKSFVVSQERIHVNIAYSAEEKYNNFLAKFSSIANRIPQRMIASYLGVSAETLSRIRKQASE